MSREWEPEIPMGQMCYDHRNGTHYCHDTYAKKIR